MEDEKHLPLSKCPTGIRGLDEITNGGLPLGRPTLICGGAGCGKTLLGVEFLVHGAIIYDEPGVLMTFEETAAEITTNVTSLGWDLDRLHKKGKLLIDHVYIEANEIEEAGEYDLEGLFIRLGYAIQKIGAKRVVLDTTEVLFAGLSHANIIRAELRRLFRWLKNQGVTTIITAEQGDNSLTRQGLEEYVSDCVIRLGHKMEGDIANRTLQIIKYRGSSHSANQYPFLIEESGISVLPITSLTLDHEVSAERISTGITALDEMFGGQGYYRGSSILVTGKAGTGKSTLAAYFAQATCKKGERCLYLATEESPKQILRNLISIGVDLNEYVEEGLLKIDSVRPTTYSLEMRLLKIHHQVQQFKPSAIIIDPMSNLILSGSLMQTKSFFMRLIDYLKSNQITGLLTNLTEGDIEGEKTDIGVSSLMDTWLELQTVKVNGERNRLLYVLKSRGMSHSNQMREFIITDKGINLVDVYLGEGKVLTGTERINQQLQEQSEQIKRRENLERQKREFARQKILLQAQIQDLQIQLNNHDEELALMMQQEEEHQKMFLENRSVMSSLRHIK
ncbi:circadian clock protein KaiC [Geminocystis sp. NIES-3708]|uniref:circadian clock protein KaiC n=1 Tax=Geminocystis sp. NIES-3708 TaxID=1615909 RepID=UPI0005FCB70A|nr:circadian clock protein KaiC [Geminocystis sp. NIES-3708]BAQ62481.1 circadian clock protein KaiC [Geminocystis sp. NIES-3708]